MATGPIAVLGISDPDVQLNDTCRNAVHSVSIAWNKLSQSYIILTQCTTH